MWGNIWLEKGKQGAEQEEGGREHFSSVTLYPPWREPLSLGRAAAACTQVPEPTLILGWSQSRQTHSTALEQTGQRKAQSHGAEELGRGWCGLSLRPPSGDLAYLGLLLIPLPRFSHGYTTVYQSILSVIKTSNKQLCIFYIWALYAMNWTLLLSLGF